MKSITKTLVGTCLTGAMLFGSLFLFSGPAFAQDQDPEHRRVYDTPVVFDRLSGAARNLLDAELGPRPGEKRPDDNSEAACERTVAV